MQEKYMKKLLETFEYLGSLIQVRNLLLSFIVSFAFAKNIRFIQFENLVAFKTEATISNKSFTLRKELNFLKIDPEYKQYLLGHENLFLEQKIMKFLPRNIRKKASKYIRPIIEVSDFYGLDPLWVISIVWTESHFKVDSKSHVGAVGLMQLMPRTRQYLEKKMKGQFRFSKVRPDIPYANEFYSKQLRNIEIGVHYLYKLKRRFHYQNLATIAYNMGPTWTKRRLNKKIKIGNNNQYLDKVFRSYKYISKKL